MEQLVSSPDSQSGGCGFESRWRYMKRQSKTAAEVDTVTSWRRYLTYLQRPGVTSGIKRQMRRRERREGRLEARDN